jgi:hypothetical protein
MGGLPQKLSKYEIEIANHFRGRVQSADQRFLSCTRSGDALRAMQPL